MVREPADRGSNRVICRKVYQDDGPGRPRLRRHERRCREPSPGPTTGAPSSGARRARRPIFREPSDSFGKRNGRRSRDRERDGQLESRQSAPRKRRFSVRGYSASLGALAFPMSLTPWRASLGPSRLGHTELPPFEVGASLLTELHLELSWDSPQVELFLDRLRADLERIGRHLVVVGPFNPRAAGLVTRLRSRCLSRRVAALEKISHEDALDILQCSGVAPAQNADLIPWTERMLISLELAARRADVIVVHAVGLDGTGERKLLDHLRVHQQEGLAVVALEYPRVGGRGSSRI